MKAEKQQYQCEIMGCEFKTRAKDPRCPNCLSRMVKPVEQKNAEARRKERVEARRQATLTNRKWLSMRL
jgi:Zn finger protein HypA/HybF involved in hydrogenase expression